MPTNEDIAKMKQEELQAAQEAASQMRTYGYSAIRTTEGWNIKNRQGVRYQDKVPDGSMPSVLEKLSAASPEEGEPGPDGTTPEDNMPQEIPKQANGSVRADDIPIFRSNPELKKALAASPEGVTVDAAGNLHIGNNKIIDDMKKSPAVDAQKTVDHVDRMIEAGLDPGEFLSLSKEMQKYLISLIDKE